MTCGHTLLADGARDLGVVLLQYALEEGVAFGLAVDAEVAILGHVTHSVAPVARTVIATGSRIALVGTFGLDVTELAAVVARTATAAAASLGRL